MYLPTTEEGMASAVGQYIWSRVAANIAVQAAAFAASDASKDPDYNPYAPKKSEPNRSDAEVFKAYVAGIRARQAGR